MLLDLTRNHRALLGAVATLMLAPLGCQEDEEPERPPSIDGGGIVPPGHGSPGMGGETSDPGEEGTAQGRVAQFLDDTFLTTAPFVSGAELQFLSTAGTNSVAARYDGNAFVADGEVLGDRWIFAASDDGSVFPTWGRYRVTAADLVVEAIPQAILDEMFVNLTTAAELNPARAHLLILVLDSGGTPVEGVEAAPFASNPPFVAYKQDSAWAHYLDETTSDGLVFVPNLEALAFPGQLGQVVLSGAVEAELDVRLCRGAITFVTHVVP